ncbi:hypothetical protein COT03_02300 [Candidatus Shapirobacteria bacterium CG07_land_8_20_14_0_80_39_18]|uniref:Uncharacterized protein n=1 Tax=Candidatus Shapirobacteria bacterium CG07_land_8_20_14_0_80_39_18 TaxID=1974882 RepID=A0A2M6YQX6_9BACT|nr:MAG: hypothetical protein COT03_02300 [Candidatus Shapirobacteria bacterium CG07_land_8_20_14_0_80_39_18]
MQAEIKEKIQVVSFFGNGQIKPILFSWRKRIYKILRIVFSYSKDIGREKIFYFSVECGGGMFELSFNREKFWWEIEKVY